MSHQTPHAALLALVPSKEELIRSLGEIIAQSAQYVLDGEPSLDYLQACELTYIGTRVEKKFLTYWNLQRFSKKSKQERRKAGYAALDTVIGGFDVDVKFTINKNWMIPRPAIGHWCMLIKADFENKTFSVGFIKATPENLSVSVNGDHKHTICADGKRKIDWLVEDAELPEVDFAQPVGAQIQALMTQVQSLSAMVQTVMRRSVRDMREAPAKRRKRSGGKKFGNSGQKARAKRAKAASA